MASKTLASIPVIDVSGSEPEWQVGKALVDAAEKHGFVFIRNLGKDIKIEDIDRQFEISKLFFATPPSEKSTVNYTPDNRGYSGLNFESLSSSQQTGDFKEAFNFGEFGTDGSTTQPLTPLLAENQPRIADFFTSCHQLCLKLLHLFGVGLEIDPETWLAERHSRDLGESGTILRYLHYPSLASIPSFRPEVDIRCGAHSDYGSLTLLFQRPGQPGLEVQSPAGEFMAVPVFPPGTEGDGSPPVLINVGDLLSYWTAGVLRSTVHRVLFPMDEEGKGDRYSMAFFCHPAHETRLDPVPSRRVEEQLSELKGGNAKMEEVDGRSITALEHLKSRLASTYKSVDFAEEKA